MVVVRSEPHLEDAPLALVRALVIEAKPFKVVAVFDHERLESRVVYWDRGVIQESVVHSQLIEEEVDIDHKADNDGHPLQSRAVEVDYFEHNGQCEVDN